jgi:Fe(3+) dicitrate transport protein
MRLRFHPSPIPALALLPLLVLAPSGLVAGFTPDGPGTVPAAKYHIAGTVVAADTGVPLSGVLVEVRELEIGAVTNSRGQFRLAEITRTEEAVTVRFSRLGFRPHEESVAAPGGEVVRLEVALEPRAMELDPVSVLLDRTRMLGDPARSAAVPGSAFVLSSHDIEAQRLPFDNVHDMLRNVPGVNVIDEEGFGQRPNIGLRGAAAQRSANITLMEDGVLIAPAPYSAPDAYYFPVAGRMEAIEVRKGASQIRYGPRTVGGALNLVTASIPDERSWWVDLSGAENSTFKAHARIGDSWERFGWLVESYRIGTDGFKELQGGGNTGFETRDLMGKLRLNTPRDAARYQELALKFGYSDHSADETYLGITEADFRSTPLLRYAASQEDALATDHRQVQLRYFLRPGERTDLVLTAYRNTFHRNWYKLQSVRGRGLFDIVNEPAAHPRELAILEGGDAAPDELRVRANIRDFVSEGVQTSFGVRFETGPARHSLETGVRFHRDHEDRSDWEDGYAMSGGRMELTHPRLPRSADNRLVEASAWAVFVQDEIRAGRWSVVPGVRWETMDFSRVDWEPGDQARSGPMERQANSVSTLVPGVGVSWEWNPWTHLFGGIHRGFAPPGPGADAGTEPERSVNYELGVRVRRPAVGVELVGFYSDYSNILGRSTLSTGETVPGEIFNGGAVEVLGAELAVDVELSRYLGTPVALPVRAAYTYHGAAFRSSFESGFGPWGTVEAGDRVPYLPEHTWSGSAGVEDDGWRLSLGWRGSGAMRTEAGRGDIPAGEGADRHLVFSLTWAVEVAGRGTLYADVQNLTDERYVVSRRPAGPRPGLPRTFSLGFRIP